VQSVEGGPWRSTWLAGKLDIACRGVENLRAMSADIEIVYERGGLSVATFKSLCMTAICGR
jgi:hypothetical protein